MDKIGFIGLGQLGLPCAETIAKAGYSVFGYDIREVASEKITQVPSIKILVENSDIIFIAVPTPHEKDYDGTKPTSHLPTKDFDYDIVINVLNECFNYVENQTVVLISTVLPGTLRNILNPKQKEIIYNPYLIALGSVVRDFLNPEMLIIGTHNGHQTQHSERIIDFYHSIILNPDVRLVFGTWEECECVKIFYNTFISTKLALVNMIQDVCTKIGNANTDIVTNALANSTKRIVSNAYMRAGLGDGGSCHPRDNIALSNLADKLNLGYDLFGSIMFSREKQAENLANFLIDLAGKHRLPIAIHGISYKPNVNVTQGSNSLLIAHYCEQKGYKPILIDNDTSYTDISAIVLLAHDTKTFYCTFAENSILVDPWREERDTNCTIIEYGNSRLR